MTRAYLGIQALACKDMLTPSFHTELWLSFASNTSADPVSGSITWPKYTADAPTTIYFAADGIASQFIDGSVVDSLCPNSTCPTCAYWNSI